MFKELRWIVAVFFVIVLSVGITVGALSRDYVVSHTSYTDMTSKQCQVDTTTSVNIVLQSMVSKSSLMTNIAEATKGMDQNEKTYISSVTGMLWSTMNDNGTEGLISRVGVIVNQCVNQAKE